MKTFGGSFEGGRWISLGLAGLCWTFALRVSSPVLHLFLTASSLILNNLSKHQIVFITLFIALNNALCAF